MGDFLEGLYLVGAGGRRLRSIFAVIEGDVGTFTGLNDGRIRIVDLQSLATEDVHDIAFDFLNVDDLLGNLLEFIGEGWLLFHHPFEMIGQIFDAFGFACLDSPDRGFSFRIAAQFTGR